MLTGFKRIIVVGASGSGKSTLVKYLTRTTNRARLKPYDVNGEYYKCPACVSGGVKNCAHIPLPDIEDFLDDMLVTKDSVQIYEEATVFFSERSDHKKIKKILVGARHNRNMVFLLFHSIADIPPKIYVLIDYVVVFNTNDERHKVSEKHPKLLAAFDAVNGKPHKFKIVKITPT